MFLCGALLGVVFAGLFGAETIPATTAVVSALPVVAFLGLVFAIPSQFVLCWAAARLDPGRVSTLIMFDVLATTVSARLLTSEPFGWHETIGCLAILAAGVTSWASISPPDPPGRGGIGPGIAARCRADALADLIRSSRGDIKRLRLGRIGNAGLS